MTGKKISVIIPAYNVENYIRRCLDSLVNQTYENIEILVVNDGSTDRTAEIVEEYADRYPGKVLLFSKENEGQAEARNFALDQATGDYIGFVDSDDFVSTKMYELLYREAEQNGCDLVTCGYYGCDDVTGEITVYQTGYRGEFNQSIYENPLILRVNSPYPWNKLYTRELLDRAGFRFQKGMIFEDLCAVFPLFLDARKVGRVHEKLYYYIKGRKGGTISTFNERHGQIIDALRIMNDAYRGRGMFERFYDTLLFFNLRHIYARFDEMKNYDNETFKADFTSRAYALLDEYFPGWKESGEFAQMEHGSGEEQEEDTDQTAEKPVRRSREKIRDKKGEKPKKRSEQFDEIASGNKIKKKVVLIECYHGNDVRGSGYYIGKMLAEEGGYQVYIAAADADKIEKFKAAFPYDWKYLDMTSEKYLEVLARAEYVINNRAFPGFYRKRKEQRFLFTDFLPSLMAQGTEMTYGARNMQGIQLSLAQADAILFPRELKDSFVPLLEKYNMAEICRDKGVFVPISLFFRAGSAGDPGIRIAYMPSVREFPGLKDVKSHLFLSELKKKLNELDERIEEGRKVYVCYPRIVRRRFKENNWKNIEFFPEEMEPYEFLAGCHALIGEYGEEMFVMQALGKPVCQFVDNRTDVDWSKGKSGSEKGISSLENMDQLADWVNHVFREHQNRPDRTPCRDFLRGIKKGKNHRVGRKVVYMPEFQTRKEFRRFMETQEIRKCVFFIEKEHFHDGMAAWLREYEGIRYMVIIRSIVVSKNESRLIKYRITTKDKLREKRDRERYLG